MNRLFFYFIILLTYISLTKLFSLGEYNVEYIRTKEDLAKTISGSPVSAILINSHSIGFLMKTYYQKYKAVYPNQRPHYFIVRVSSSFYEDHLGHIGLSLFRRSEQESKESFIAAPPGLLFIGRPSYGKWIGKKDNRTWKFHRYHRRLERYLGLQDYEVHEEFYQTARRFEIQNKTFLGLNREFGTGGSISQKAFPQYFLIQRRGPPGFAEFLSRFFDRAQNP